MKVYLPCGLPDVSDMKFHTFSFLIDLHPIFRFIIEEKKVYVMARTKELAMHHPNLDKFYGDEDCLVEVVVLLFDPNKSIEGKVLNLPRKNLEEIYQTIKSLEEEINLLFDTKKAELLKKAYEQIINILERANELRRSR